MRYPIPKDFGKFGIFVPEPSDKKRREKWIKWHKLRATMVPGLRVKYKKRLGIVPDDAVGVIQEDKGSTDLYHQAKNWVVVAFDFHDGKKVTPVHVSNVIVLDEQEKD